MLYICTKWKYSLCALIIRIPLKTEYTIKLVAQFIMQNSCGSTSVMYQDYLFEKLMKNGCPTYH